MAHKIPLQVFLSYRSHWTDKLKQLQQEIKTYNEQPDSVYLIELKVSESELKKGDSITGFMETMATARFVILMLGREYFESPYCLYELLGIHRNGQALERLFGLPVNIDDSLYKITEESFLQSWQGEFKIKTTKEQGYCQARLRELQAAVPATGLGDFTTDEEKDAKIKEHLQEAFQKIIQPLINNLTFPCESGGQIVDMLVKKADSVFVEEEQALLKRLVGEVELRIRDMEKEDRESLGSLLGVRDALPQKIATVLLAKSSQGALAVMLQLVEQRYPEIPLDDATDWKKFFSPVNSICGWLLLKSVSSPWWIHNGISLVSHQRDKGHVTLDIEKPAYAEVVISRGLLKAAEYCLDTGNNPVPACFSELWGNDFSEKEKVCFEHDFVLDASDKAEKEALLLPIVYDLKLQPESMVKDPEKLLQELISFARVTLRPKYYIVTNDYLNRLQGTKINGVSILEQINSALKDKLVFITYGTNGQGETGGPTVCGEDETDLLNTLVLILATNGQRLRSLKRRGKWH